MWFNRTRPLWSDGLATVDVNNPSHTVEWTWQKYKVNMASQKMTKNQTFVFTQFAQIAKLLWLFIADRIYQVRHWPGFYFLSHVIGNSLHWCSLRERDRRFRPLAKVDCPTPASTSLYDLNENIRLRHSVCWWFFQICKRTLQLERGCNLIYQPRTVRNVVVSLCCMLCRLPVYEHGRPRSPDQLTQPRPRHAL